MALNLLSLNMTQRQCLWKEFVYFSISIVKTSYNGVNVNIDFNKNN